MLRVLAKLTFLSVCAGALGCELIMRDLPPKAERDAAMSPQEMDAGEVLHVDGGPHVDASAGDGDGDGARDAALPDGPQDAGVDAALPLPDPDGCDGASERLFFLDGDGDEYGDPSTAVAACVKPTSGGKWVEQGKDCNDDEPDVHPGQTEFFGQGYQRKDDSSVLSFDYDCNNSEAAKPGQDREVDCAGLLGVACAGGGYAPNDERKGLVGINEFCGSNVISTCVFSSLTCQAPLSTTDQPYLCK